MTTGSFFEKRLFQRYQERFKQSYVLTPVFDFFTGPLVLIYLTVSASEGNYRSPWYVFFVFVTISLVSSNLVDFMLV